MRAIEFVKQIEFQAHADQTWLGSEKHRSFVEAYARSRKEDASVVWGPDDEPSYLEGASLIVLQSPGPNPDATVQARDQGLGAHHEVMHLVHSDNVGAADFRLAVALRPFKLTARLLQELFQLFEDARIATQEALEEPEALPLARELYIRVVAQKEAIHRAHTGDEVWTRSPKPLYRVSQLSVALINIALLGVRPELVDGRVDSALDETEPIVRRAIEAPDTAGARAGAVDVVGTIELHWQELLAGA